MALVQFRKNQMTKETKQSPIKAIDDDTIEAIKNVLEIITGQSDAVYSIWNDMTEYTRLINQAVLGIKVDSESDQLDGLLLLTSNLLTSMQKNHDEYVLPLAVNQQNFKNVFNEEFDLKSEIEKITLH